MENNFAVFILTHGRPDKVLTDKTLAKCGYNGMLYYVVDNEDNQLHKYIENYGTDKVKIFDKKLIVIIVTGKQIGRAHV